MQCWLSKTLGLVTIGSHAKQTELAAKETQNRGNIQLKRVRGSGGVTCSSSNRTRMPRDNPPSNRKWFSGFVQTGKASLPVDDDEIITSILKKPRPTHAHASYPNSNCLSREAYIHPTILIQPSSTHSRRGEGSWNYIWGREGELGWGYLLHWVISVQQLGNTALDRVQPHSIHSFTSHTKKCQTTDHVF